MLLSQKPKQLISLLCVLLDKIFNRCVVYYSRGCLNVQKSQENGEGAGIYGVGVKSL